MKKQVIAIKAAAVTGEPKVPGTTATPDEPGFLSANQLLQLVPISPGTLRNWMAKGAIPYIATPGRRVLFDWPSVRESLLRRQRGGLL